MKKQLGKHVIYFIIAAALAFLIVIPILTVFLEAVTVNGRLDFSNAVQVIWNSSNLHTIGNSLLLGILVVITSTLIATPLAFILVRTRFSRKKWLDIIFMIPFMTPPYISSMGWILFMQKRGLFQQMFPWVQVAKCVPFDSHLYIRNHSTTPVQEQAFPSFFLTESATFS